MPKTTYTKAKHSSTYWIANRATIMGRVNVLKARSVSARDMIKSVRYSFRRLRDFSKAIMTRRFKENPIMDRSDKTREVNVDSPVEYTQPSSFDRLLSFDSLEQYFSLFVSLRTLPIGQFVASLSSSFSNSVFK